MIENINEQRKGIVYIDRDYRERIISWKILA